MNKKKFICLMLVALLAVTSVFAARSPRGATKEGQWGVGLNLGTNTGVAVKYGYGEFDAFGNFGFDILNNLSKGRVGVTVDLGASYKVYDVDFGKGHHMPITVGAMIPLNFYFGDSFIFNLGVLAQAGIEYQIPDVPVSFYLRLGAGVGMDLAPEFKVGPAFAGGLGVLYVF